MDIFEIRRARLRELIDEFTQGNISVFARRFGYSRAQLSQYISETYNDGRSIGERAARTLESKLELAPGSLDQSMGSATLRVHSHNANTVLRGEDSATMARQIPLKFVALPIHKSEGVVELVPTSEGSPDEHIEFYPASNKAYAVLVKGSGLRARIKSGELLVVDPEISPSPGDDVLVQLEHDGSTLVVQLLYFRGDDVTLGNINESGPAATFPLSKLTYMYPISAILSIPEKKM